jgi:hypothetical protein
MFPTSLMYAYIRLASCSCIEPDQLTEKKHITMPGQKPFHSDRNQRRTADTVVLSSEATLGGRSRQRGPMRKIAAKPTVVVAKSSFRLLSVSA